MIISQNSFVTFCIVSLISLSLAVCQEGVPPFDSIDDLEGTANRLEEKYGSYLDKTLAHLPDGTAAQVRIKRRWEGQHHAVVELTVTGGSLRAKDYLLKLERREKKWAIVDQAKLPTRKAMADTVWRASGAIAEGDLETLSWCFGRHKDAEKSPETFLVERGLGEVVDACQNKAHVDGVLLAKHFDPPLAQLTVVSEEKTKVAHCFALGFMITKDGELRPHLRELGGKDAPVYADLFFDAVLVTNGLLLGADEEKREVEKQTIVRDSVRVAGLHPAGKPKWKDIEVKNVWFKTPVAGKVLVPIFLEEDRLTPILVKRNPLPTVESEIAPYWDFIVGFQTTRNSREYVESCIEKPQLSSLHEAAARWLDREYENPDFELLRRFEGLAFAPGTSPNAASILFRFILPWAKQSGRSEYARDTVAKMIKEPRLFHQGVNLSRQFAPDLFAKALSKAAGDKEHHLLFVQNWRFATHVQLVAFADSFDRSVFTQEEFQDAIPALLETPEGCRELNKLNQSSVEDAVLIAGLISKKEITCRMDGQESDQEDEKIALLLASLEVNDETPEVGFYVIPFLCRTKPEVGIPLALSFLEESKGKDARSDIAFVRYLGLMLGEHFRSKEECINWLKRKEAQQ